MRDDKDELHYIFFQISRCSFHEECGKIHNVRFREITEVYRLCIWIEW